MRIVIDEDLPRSLGVLMREHDHEVLDIRDHGFRGEPDERIFQFTQEKHAVLFTADLGFANILSFPLGTHKGICVLRFPNEMPNDKINTIVLDLLKQLSQQDIEGNLIIFTPKNFRIRRK